MKRPELQALIREAIAEVSGETTRGGKPIHAIGAPGSQRRNAAITDPSKEEMMQFLKQQFGGSEEGFEDSAEVAIYWFANFYHGGQWSNLYSVLSMSPFRPGPIARGPEPGSMEEDMFHALEMEYGGKTHQHGNEEDMLHEANPKVLSHIDNNFFRLTPQQAKEFSVDGQLPRPGYEKKADMSKLRGYMGDFNHHLEPIEMDDTTTGWILTTRTGGETVWALRLHSKMQPMREDGAAGAGAAGGGQGGVGQPGTGMGNVTANVDPIRTPFAFKHPKDLPAHRKEEATNSADEDALYVEFVRERPGEEPFMMHGQKFQYVTAKYPSGKEDVAVYAFAGDMTYGYNAWRQMWGIKEENEPQVVINDPEKVKVKIKEEEQPEMYDDKTDTFAPGPRQRPEDWKKGTTQKPVPKLKDLLKPKKKG